MRLAAIVVSLCVGASVRLFVWPATDHPAHADAILALANDVRRLNKALALARTGYSPIVVVSTGDRRKVPCPPRPSEGGIEIFCFSPDPDTTQGEARYMHYLAAQHNWRRIMIVPGTTQASRARMLFKRCYSGQLLVVPAREPVGGVFYNIAYEWGALGKAFLLRRGC